MADLYDFVTEYERGDFDDLDDFIAEWRRKLADSDGSKKLENLHAQEYITIDRTSGTVMGTNVAVAKVPAGDKIEDLLESDQAAREYAKTNGRPLYVKF